MKGVKYSTSPHTLSALELRREGRYKEALAKLNLAVSEKDPVAIYLKAQAYEEGGWGLYKDIGESHKLYYESACSGCPWAMIHCLDEEIVEKSRERRRMFRKAFQYNDNWVIHICYFEGFYKYDLNWELSDHYLNLAKEEKEYNPAHFMTVEFKDAKSLHDDRQYEEAGFKQKFQRSLFTIAAMEKTK